MTQESEKPIDLLQTPEFAAAVAQAVAAAIAQQPVPEPEPPRLAPLAEPLWTGLVHYVKHDGAIDERWAKWLRDKLGEQFDIYVEAYKPGGVHYFGVDVWDRVP